MTNFRQIFILSFIFVFIPAVVVYAAWSTTTKATDNQRHDGEPHVAMENDNLHMVFQSDDDQYYYKKKLANKSRWSSRVKLTSNAYDVGESAITAYNGKAHVVYEAGNFEHLDIAYTTNKPGSWSTPVRVTNDKVYDTSPQITQEGGKLYLVFLRENSKGLQVFFTKNTNGTWTKPVAISNISDNVTGAFIFVKNGKIYITWTAFTSNAYGVTLRYKVFSNEKWSAIQTVANPTSSKAYAAGSIFVYKSVPYIAYETVEDISRNVGFAYLSNGKWIKKTITSNIPYTYNSEPKIKVYNNKIKLVWDKYVEDGVSEGTTDIWYAIANSPTSSFTKSNLTKTSKKNEANSQIAIDSKGKSHVFWQALDSEGDSEIFYKKQL